MGAEKWIRNAIDACMHIWNADADFGSYMGFGTYPRGVSITTVLTTMSTHKRPITGNLYPFLNMSVDEAGIIFLGNNPPALPANEAIAIGDIQRLFEFAFNGECTPSLETALSTVQVFTLTSDVKKMINYLATADRSLCVTKGILTSKTQKQATISNVVIILMELVAYALTQATYFKDVFEYLGYAITDDGRGKSKDFLEMEKKILDAKILGSLRTNFYAMTGTARLDSTNLRYFSRFDSDLRYKLEQDTDQLIDAFDDIVTATASEVFPRIFSQVYKFEKCSNQTDACLTCINFYKENESDFDTIKKKFQKNARMDLFSRLEARDEIVYSTSPKKMLENLKLSEFITPRDVLKVEDSELLNGALTFGFYDKLYSLRYDTPTYLFALGYNPIKKQAGSVLVDKNLVLVSILHLLRKTGMLLSNAL